MLANLDRRAPVLAFVPTLCATRQSLQVRSSVGYEFTFVFYIELIFRDGLHHSLFYEFTFVLLIA